MDISLPGDEYTTDDIEGSGCHLAVPDQLAAGLPGRIPHDFRRTAVRNLERAGVPRSVAMKMVGHRTESVYRRYAIVDEAMLREGAEKLARLAEAATGITTGITGRSELDARSVSV